MRKRILSLLMATTLAVTTFGGMCQSASATSSQKVSISFYTTEVGKDKAFQSIITSFEKLYPSIKVEYIAAGDNQLQKWMALYASKQGPTVSLMDPVDIKENMNRMRPYNQKESPWLNNVVKDSLGLFTFSNKVYGVPMSVAGFGLLYNQRVLNKAVGGTFNPATIKSRSDLEKLFKKIQATGVAASMFTGVNWSLGSHYLGLVYGAYRGDVNTRVAFTKAEKNGTAHLAKDKVFNNLMDTFDLIAKYNYNKNDPLVGNLNKDAEAFATGKVGTWFMGDWAWSIIAATPGRDKDFGILPVPYSNDPKDKMNTVIPTAYAKGYCIDASQNTKAQQQAGLKFVQYITMSGYGQQTMSKAEGQTLPFKNNKATATSPLSNATKKYIAAGKNYNFYGTADMLPSDFWYVNGAFMCEYLSGACNRTTLANSIDGYWKGKK